MIGFDCSKYKSNLSALIDEQLDADGFAETNEHLTSCGECSHELVKLQDLQSAFWESLAKASPVVPDLWKDIEPQIPSICSLIPEDISAYLDGELLVAAQEGVKNHLRNCPQCLETFHTLTKTNQLLGKSLAAASQCAIDDRPDLWLAIKSELNENCSLINADLSAFLDQEVPNLRQRAITSHLLECGNCSQIFERFTKIGDALNKYYQPLTGLKLDLLPAIRDRLMVVPFRTASKQPAERDHTLKLALQYSLIAVLAFACLCTGGFYLFMHNKEDAATPSSEEYIVENCLEEPAAPDRLLLSEE